ncbi:esterase/lipase family protein [Tomitella gaofuii]|uniref:esterase/lipase family protein n=1 Tax=Tomitella gaofuii TaxID=2760083 RepID=UPI0015F88DFC|nr:alpha/beta fold hydrolase [Tomitella gaofuii]
MSASVFGAGAPAAAAPLPVPDNFYAGVAAELANPGGSLPGSNDYDCAPTQDHPRPVILLHDLGATRQSNWATFVPALANEGYCVYAVTYGVVPGKGFESHGQPLGGTAPIEASAGELADFVDGVLEAPGTRRAAAAGIGDGTVDLLGHAEGALVAGYYAKVLNGADSVHEIVSLAPTWRGAGGDMAARYADRIPPQWRAAVYDQMPYFMQVMTGSDVIEALNAGGTPYAPGVEYTNIVTRYNWGIDYSSGLVPGQQVTNIVVQDGCNTDYSEHDGIGASPRTVAFVLNALDPAHPRPVPCGVILPFVGTMVD